MPGSATGVPVPASAGTGGQSASTTTSSPTCSPIWRRPSGGSFASCEGFTSEGTLISDMPLSTLATFNDYARGMGGWDVTSGTQSRTYEVTWKFDTAGLTQGQLDALQGAQTGIDIQWELQSS